jgi:hypothetical protein
MTLQQALDEVMLVCGSEGPNQGETALVFAINNAIREMARESLCIRDIVTLPTADPGNGQSWVDGETTRFVLDSHIIKIYAIWSGSMQVSPSGLPVRNLSGAGNIPIWYMDGGFLYIGFIGNQQLIPFSAGSAIELSVAKSPDETRLVGAVELYSSQEQQLDDSANNALVLTSQTRNAELPIPPAYHEGIVARVIESRLRRKAVFEAKVSPEAAAAFNLLARDYHAVWRKSVKVASAHHWQLGIAQAPRLAPQ